MLSYPLLWILVPHWPRPVTFSLLQVGMKLDYESYLLVVFCIGLITSHINISSFPFPPTHTQTHSLSPNPLPFLSHSSILAYMYPNDLIPPPKVTKLCPLPYFPHFPATHNSVPLLSLQKSLCCFPSLPRARSH